MVLLADDPNGEERRLQMRADVNVFQMFEDGKESELRACVDPLQLEIAVEHFLSVEAVRARASCQEQIHLFLRAVAMMSDERVFRRIHFFSDQASASGENHAVQERGYAAVRHPKEIRLIRCDVVEYVFDCIRFNRSDTAAVDRSGLRRICLIHFIRGDRETDHVACARLRSE